MAQNQQPQYSFPYGAYRQQQPTAYPYYGAAYPGTQAYPGVYGTTHQPISSQVPGMLPLEESYIENILRLNKGKTVTVFMTFEGNQQKVFQGVIEAAGRDHLILSDPKTGLRYLLLMVYLDYITFPEEINYQYPYGGTAADSQMATYSPR